MIFTLILVAVFFAGSALVSLSELGHPVKTSPLASKWGVAISVIFLGLVLNALRWA